MSENNWKPDPWELYTDFPAHRLVRGPRGKVRQEKMDKAEAERLLNSAAKIASLESQLSAQAVELGRVREALNGLRDAGAFLRSFAEMWLSGDKIGRAWVQEKEQDFVTAFLASDKALSSPAPSDWLARHDAEVMAKAWADVVGFSEALKMVNNAAGGKTKDATNWTCDQIIHHYCKKAKAECAAAKEGK